MARIRLEDTLSDFFAREDRLAETRSSQKVFAAFSPSSDFEFTPDLPRNTRYLLPQWRTSNGNLPSPRTNLVLMPQRISWITGKMPVMFYKGDGQENGIYGDLEDDLNETFGVITAECRLEPHFFTSLRQTPFNVRGFGVVPFLPSDDLAECFSLTTEPDVHYKLHSKRALALSGIATPKAQLIDFGPDEIGCTGRRLDDAVARAINTIQNRTIPFVLKTNYCAGGRGTYLVHNLADQAAVLQSVRDNLPSDLQKLNSKNVHLHPCGLVLTDMLLGTAVGVNFYVYSNGEARFSSCCKQHLSKTNHWQGAAITYSMQSHLANLYANIIQETAAFLHSHGYYGPAGIDVMTDGLGKHKVVDLNPRPTGTFLLGCLRPHFVDELGMDEACMLPTMGVPSNRAGFAEAFEQELRVGEIVILTWCTDREASRSWMCLAVGGRKRSSLHALCKRIEKWVQTPQRIK